MKHYLSKILKLVYTFYTWWAIVMHIGYFFGLYQSTFLIAVIVFLGSFFLNVIYPGYARIYTRSVKDFFIEFCLHHLPLLLLPRTIPFDAQVLLTVSVIIYIYVHKPQKIYRYYSDIRKECSERIFV